MRTWAINTSKVHILCGYDATHWIRSGQRYQLIRLLNVDRAGIRCEQCADRSTELQGVDVPSSEVIRPDFTRISEVDTPLTRDHKQLRAGS